MAVSVSTAAQQQLGVRSSPMHEVNNELQMVKCVVVGDTAVGKTRLVCSRACDTRYTLPQLVQTHVPTVWAIDQYRKNPQVLSRSWCNVDGLNVSLRLWDTFGDHDKDRKFAYDRADVVLVCFNVTQPRTLRNVRSYWHKEIQRLCADVPVVVCACQIDLRHLYKDENFINMDKGPFYRDITDADVILPEVGRSMAKSIGAHYYETSILEEFGIDTLFLNIVRAALVAKRDRHFWTTFGSLRRISKPQLQKPHLFPKPVAPVARVSGARLTRLSHQALLENGDELYDVIFRIRGTEIKAHRICLVVGCSVFDKVLLADPQCKDISDDSGIITDNSSACTNLATSVDSFEASKFESLSLSSSISVLYGRHPGVFSSMESPSDSDDSESSSSKRACITVSDSVSVAVFQALIDYIYTGVCPGASELLEEIKCLAGVLGMQDLVNSITNVQNGEEFLNKEIEADFYRRRKQRMKELALQKKIFADVVFRLDDGLVSAHRLILVMRCEVMSSMFTGSFTERSAKMVEFPGVSCETFQLLLEYLYVEECQLNVHSAVSCMELIEVANRLCQTQLIQLIEHFLIRDLIQARKSKQDITEDVILYLEPAQLHNSRQLSAWCLWYLVVHYRNVCTTHSRLLHTLSPDNQIYLATNCWPPTWYLKEHDMYEKYLIDVQREKSQKSRNVSKSTSSTINSPNRDGCFCFVGGGTNRSKSPMRPEAAPWEARTAAS